MSLPQTFDFANSNLPSSYGPERTAVSEPILRRRELLSRDSLPFVSRRRPRPDYASRWPTTTTLISTIHPPDEPAEYLRLRDQALAFISHPLEYIGRRHNAAAAKEAREMEIEEAGRMQRRVEMPEPEYGRWWKKSPRPGQSTHPYDTALMENSALTLNSAVSVAQALSDSSNVPPRKKTRWLRLAKQTSLGSAPFTDRPSQAQGDMQHQINEAGLASSVPRKSSARLVVHSRANDSGTFD